MQKSFKLIVKSLYYLGKIVYVTYIIIIQTAQALNKRVFGVFHRLVNNHLIVSQTCNTSPDCLELNHTKL
jgi:hypothetical protein